MIWVFKNGGIACAGINEGLPNAMAAVPDLDATPSSAP